MYIGDLKMSIIIKLLMNLLDYLCKLTILTIENCVEIFYSIEYIWTIKNIDIFKKFIWTKLWNVVYS